MKHMILRDTAD